MSETSTGVPVTLTDATFKDMVRKNQLVVVDCWAAWCQPCRMIAPSIEQLAKEYAGKVLFGKLNVDENMAIPSEYNIMSIPTLLFFRNGEHVDTIIGAVPKSAIKETIDRHLAR